MMNGPVIYDDKSRFLRWQVEIFIFFLFWHKARPLAKLSGGCFVVKLII